MSNQYTIGHGGAEMTATPKRDLETSGEPILARYNPPFMPSFLRRNEVLIPVTRKSAR